MDQQLALLQTMLAALLSVRLNVMCHQVLQLAWAFAMSAYQ